MSSDHNVSQPLLTQGETRKTKRVRLFTEFVSRSLAAYAPLLAGLDVRKESAVPAIEA